MRLSRVKTLNKKMHFYKFWFFSFPCVIIRKAHHFLVFPAHFQNIFSKYFPVSVDTLYTYEGPTLVAHRWEGGRILEEIITGKKRLKAILELNNSLSNT